VQSGRRLKQQLLFRGRHLLSQRTFYPVLYKYVVTNPCERVCLQYKEINAFMWYSDLTNFIISHTEHFL
jgi:hypothetical protein